MSSWKETEPGRFERPFDSIEMFFVALARGTAPIKREHYSLNIAAKFQAPFSSEDALRRFKNAWITMRYDHPEIASTLQGDTKVYEVPDALGLDEWLQETFLVAADTATVEDLVASFQPQSLASVYFLPHSWEILVHSSHWRMDGIGGINFLNNLFAAAAKPRPVEFGDEGRNLTPCRDEAASFITAGIGCDERQINQVATDLLATLTDNMPSIGLPTDSQAVMPQGTRRLEHKFDTTTTSRIVSACKAMNVTVTVAVHSAMIQATQQLASAETVGKKYASWGLFSLRPGLPDPFNDTAAHPTSANVMGLPLVVSPSTFGDNVVQLREFYKQPLPTSAHSTLPPIMIPYSNKIVEMVSQPPHPDAPPLSEPVLSSLGIMDPYLDGVHGDVEITGFFLGGEIDTRQIMCHLWTWRGEMVLSACYNEAFYEPRSVRGYLARTFDILLAELGISDV